MGLPSLPLQLLAWAAICLLAGTGPSQATAAFPVAEESPEPTPDHATSSPNGASSPSPGQAPAPPWVPTNDTPCPDGAASPSTPQPTPDLTPDLFRAVAASDIPAVENLISAGVDVNATLSHPAPDDLVQRFLDTNLEFFVRQEKGLTPLMLASAMGNPDLVKSLLARGARRHAVTQKHKTFALWLAGRGSHVEVMQILLGVEAGSEAARYKIRVSLDDQTAFVWKDGVIQQTIPISSGRKKFPTPKGRYVVTNKYKDWKSTIYRVKMPYYLRLSCQAFGLHAGALPGYPASHGCIRLPPKDAASLFAEVPVGTLVEIE